MNSLSQINVKEFIKNTIDNNYKNFLFSSFKNQDDERFYFEMFLIRTFEKKLLEAYGNGLIHGTTHTYIGQECNSVALFENLTQEDFIWSNHRCHGHFISYCGKLFELMAEIFGKKNGISKGRGGSQHLNFKNFFSNGILGGSIPQAVGSSYSLKEDKNNNISVIFIGDGTMGEGILYESLNLASLWDCPILFVCENNFIAQTTPISQNLAGTIKSRVQSFNIKYEYSYNYNFGEILDKSKKTIEFVRNYKKPAFFEIYSNRLGPHSKGDDTRSEEVLNNLALNDVLIKFKKKINNNIEIENKVIEIIDKIYDEVTK